MATPRITAKHLRDRSISPPKGEANKLRVEDRAVHDWYRFVLSFPAHLVKEYVEAFQVDESQTVLDPFCGTGTTLVECKKLGIRSVGIEANPMPHFASSVKTDWDIDPESLLRHARGIAKQVLQVLDGQGFGEYENDTLPIFNGQRKGAPHVLKLAPEQARLLLKDSISPIPLHKVLTLRDYLERSGTEPFIRYERLALAKTIVFASNLHFGPEVGVGPAKLDAPVVSLWEGAVAAMAEDLRALGGPGGPSLVCSGDARDVANILSPKSVDAVITSPPYPNEKDYTRTTRLESVLLGYFKSMRELRALKKTLVRSNTRSVYKEDSDHSYVASNPEIERIARDIEDRRVALGKTSGFERQYARVTKLYFGGMARHLSELRTVLKPGARLAYVVGDQASYLRVMIRTGELLADIASSLGYDVIGIDLFRTRLSTATKEQLREEVLLLRWPG